LNTILTFPILIYFTLKKLAEIDRINAVSKEVRESILTEGGVSKKLLDKALGKNAILEPLIINSKSRGVDKRLTNAPKSVVRMLPPLDVDHDPSNSAGNNSRDDELTAQRRKLQVASNYVWTNEERNKLNDLYWEVPKPPVGVRKIAAWDVYYSTIVSRFLQAFPLRTANEVKGKVEEMIQRRQMKEHAEKEYWQSRKSRAKQTNDVSDDMS
jgi:hypothetical protein